jgi:hypothetical protein
MWWEPFVFVGCLAFMAILFLVINWRMGQLRDMFNEWPQVDKYMEGLAGKMDEGYEELKAKYEELKKWFEEWSKTQK